MLLCANCRMCYVGIYVTKPTCVRGGHSNVVCIPVFEQALFWGTYWRIAVQIYAL